MLRVCARLRVAMGLFGLCVYVTFSIEHLFRRYCGRGI